MLYSVYSKTGDVAIVKPLAELAELLNINQAAVKRIVDGDCAAPKGLIIGVVPRKTPERCTVSKEVNIKKAFDGIRRAYGSFGLKG